MIQPNHRISFVITTVQMQPTELVEADFRLPAGQFRKLTDANELARQGKLYVHKATALDEVKDGEASQGLMQSAMFNIDDSNGKQELVELMDAIKQTAIERMYP